MDTLVVRLKESLDIENPVYLNEVLFSVETGASQKLMRVVATTKGYVRLVMPKNLTMTSTGSIIQVPHVNTNEYIIDSTTSSDLTFTIADNNGERWVKLVGIDGLKYLDNDYLAATQVRIRDISNLKFAKNLTNFGGDNFCNAVTKGNLSDLCHYKMSSLILGNSVIRGTIESMVETFWSNGRRSGTCTIDKLGNPSGQVQFHNANIAHNSIWVFRFSENSVTVESPSGTTKGTYDGTTWTYA